MEVSEGKNEKLIEQQKKRVGGKRMWNFALQRYEMNWDIPYVF